MSQYLLLLYDSAENLEQFLSMSPEEIQGAIEKYTAWSQKLAREGKLQGGEKLRDGEGRVLYGGANGIRVTDGPFSETKDVIGGYFLISADSYDEAVAISRSCPHLEHGGTIEIREIEAMPVPEPRYEPHG